MLQVLESTIRHQVQFALDVLETERQVAATCLRTGREAAERGDMSRAKRHYALASTALRDIRRLGHTQAERLRVAAGRCGARGDAEGALYLEQSANRLEQDAAELAETVAQRHGGLPAHLLAS